jgi:hypothetical protein
MISATRAVNRVMGLREGVTSESVVSSGGSVIGRSENQSGR